MTGNVTPHSWPEHLTKFYTSWYIHIWKTVCTQSACRIFVSIIIKLDTQPYVLLGFVRAISAPFMVFTKFCSELYKIVNMICHQNSLDRFGYLKMAATLLLMKLRKSFCWQRLTTSTIKTVFTDVNNNIHPLRCVSFFIMVSYCTL